MGCKERPRKGIFSDLRCFAARAKKRKRGWGRGRKEPAFLASPPLLWLSHHFSREQNAENPVPLTFFAPQPHGKACYARYKPTSISCMCLKSMTTSVISHSGSSLPISSTVPSTSSYRPHGAPGGSLADRTSKPEHSDRVADGLNRLRRRQV